MQIVKPRNLVANYELEKYNITTSVSPENSGSATGDSTYNHGDEVTVTATANSEAGYDFLNWTENGSPVSTNATYTFTANKSRNLVANFILRSYAITLSVFPENSGTVTGQNNYTHGSEVTVIATPKAGWLFVNWTEGDVNVSNTPQFNFTVFRNRSLKANLS